ncbi:MAG: hypothetical protein QOD29_5976, partial [Alphaproteobacteria bacterium]|nr:hypothetical protein [Alphaproteobacteria bacterium]
NAGLFDQPFPNVGVSACLSFREVRAITTGDRLPDAEIARSLNTLVALVVVRSAGGEGENKWSASQAKLGQGMY